MRGITPALERRIRAVDPTARTMVEGRIETAADVRQRYDQWQQLDSLPGAAELLGNGGVRLKATNANGPNSSTVTSGSTYYRPIADTAGSPKYAIDPFGPAFIGTNYKLGVLVEWKGSESAHVELTQVQAWLHPQFDLTGGHLKTVAQWQCELFAVVAEQFISEGAPNPSTTIWTLRPLTSGPVRVDALGQAAGFVSFDFTNRWTRPRPKQYAFVDHLETRRILMIAVFTGLDKDGLVATNIGWGYDSGHSSAVSAAGSTMEGHLFQWIADPNSFTQSPGSVVDAGPSGTVPAAKFLIASVSRATVAFSNGTNDINLGAATPKAQIELVGRGQVPPTADLTFEVRDDASVWRAFTDGQTLDQLTGFASGSYTTLKMRSTLIPTPALDSGPVLRALGARAVTTRDLSDIAEVQSVSWAVDPADHHAEVPQLVLRAIHDGERDFRDAISEFLSQQPIGKLSLRLFAGAPIGVLVPVILQLVDEPENFSVWTDVSSPVLTSGQSDPLGGTRAYLIEDTQNFSVNGKYRLVTFTGDGEKAFSIYMKQGTSATALFGIFDNTAVQWRHSVKITWSAGVPTLSHSTGTGALFTPVDVGGGWWKLTATAVGVVAANVNRFYLYVTEDNPTPTGTTYFFRANAWNQATPPADTPPPITKGDWIHLDDFFIDDYDLAADAVYVTAVSSLAFVRGALPKLTDQAAAYPASTISNPGSWTEAGGAADLWAALADNRGGVGVLPWDDLTYLLSATNPSNADITVALDPISVPAKPIVDQVEVQVRAARVGGSSLTLSVALLEGATQRATASFTVSSTTILPFALKPTVTELSAITDWSNLRIRIRANGTGSLKVSWARLVEFPRRPDLEYSNATPQFVLEDLLANQVALPDSQRGPDFTGVPGLDTGTPLQLGKKITAPAGQSTDLTIAKQQLDALAFVAGAFLSSSQGRVGAHLLYDVAVDPDGTVHYAPRTEAPLVYFPREEIRPTSVRPGYQYRVPLFDVSWGFNQSGNENRYQGVAHGVSAIALEALGEARIMAQQQAPETVCTWIPDQGIANALSQRQVLAFGLGLLVWRFTSTYAYPELELGDVIAVETDQFLAYDPTAARAIAGAQWVAGFVVGIYDAKGRDFAIWIPSYASFGAIRAPSRPEQPQLPTGSLIFDGDLETPGAPGWDLNGVNFSLEVAGNVYAGAASLKLESSGGGGITIYCRQTSPRRAFPGNVPLQLEAVGKFGATGASSELALEALFYDANGVLLAVGVGPLWTTETAFTPKSVTVTSDPGTVSIGFRVRFRDGGGAATWLGWIDNMRAFYPGNTPAANLTGAFVELPTISGDRGDASVTLVPGVDPESQRFATALTANRTVTLAAGYKGAKFRVTRTGLGAFTLDVGGLKTIPNSTAAFVDVQHDGSAWRLMAYGTL